MSQFRTIANNYEEKYKTFLFRFIDTLVRINMSKIKINCVVECFVVVLLCYDYILHKKKQIECLRKAFSVNGYELFRLTVKYIALPFKDYTVCKMIISGRESVAEWPISENNKDAINELLNSGRSFIVANGHFTRQAYLALFRRDVAPSRLIQVTLPPNPETGWKAYDHRIELQLGTSLAAAQSLRPDDLTYSVVTKDQHIFHTMRRHLKMARGIVMINIDAPWEGKDENTLSRPFAGFSNRKFAKGVIELARISGCPIVSCITYVNTDGSITIQWGDPIYVSADSQPAEGVAHLNHLLDVIENAVGRRPDQYLMPIGSDRSWDKERSCWSFTGSPN